MFKVETKTSFWKHPFKWWRDRKSARLFGKILDYKWKNGLEKEFDEYRKHHLLYGHVPNGNPCKICNL